MGNIFIFGMTAEELDASASMLTFVIALAALFLAWRQLVSSKQEARNALAKTLYREYILLAMQNPEFSMPSYPVENPKMLRFSGDPKQYDAYEFYVSHMLYAVEEIVDMVRGTPEWSGWRETILSQMEYHALYLKSDDFPRSHWSSDVLSLVDEAIESYSQSPKRPSW